MIDRDKSHLFGPFAQVLVEFERRLAEAELPFYLFEGLRTWERQAELYAQGRSQPGKIVTCAKPGYSFHAFGMGADYVLDGMLEKPDVQWSWELKADLNRDGYNDWKQMAEIARKCGLDSSYFWTQFPEAPHVQLTFGLTAARARALYQSGGLLAVWAEAMDWLEKRVWPTH